MFLLEVAIGWFAQSTALMADSLDMLADAAVFGIPLLGVGRCARFKSASRLQHRHLSVRPRLCRGGRRGVTFSLWQRPKVSFYDRDWAPRSLLKSTLHDSSAETSLWRGAYSC